MATNVHLTPQLEEFARSLVETGRYNSVSEVMREGLRLLQEREDRRKAFMEMIADTRAEMEREGTFTMEEVSVELEAIINGNK